MSRCRFCGQDFSNKQAVRAHLKACTAYLGRFSRQAALPEANAELPLGNAETTSADHAEPEFDPVWQMQRQVSSEKLRLKLREVREAHAELDSREQAKQRAAAEQQAREAQLRDAEMRSREALRVRAQAEAETLERAREAKERLRGKRRAAIQEIKHYMGNELDPRWLNRISKLSAKGWKALVAKVVDEWLLRFRLSSELKGQILQAIETALVSLPTKARFA